MYRSLAIIIAAVVATSAMGESEEEPFYRSLRALGAECKRAAAVLESVTAAPSRPMNYDTTKAMFACMAYITGVTDGLSFDARQPSLMCIKNLTVSGNDLMRAFAHYYSTLQKTGAGQKILHDFEGSPGQFTVRALGAIYGCTGDNPPGFAAAGTRIGEQGEQAPADIDVSGVTPTEEPPITVPGMVVEKELNFDDLIPEKKPR